MTFQRILMVFLLIFLSHQYSFSQQYHAQSIPEDFTPPVIDGVLSDPIWSLAEEDTCLLGDSGAWGTPWTWFSNNLVTWRAVWSANTNQLFVAVKVRDDIRSTFDNNNPSVNNFRPWYDDSIEFYTDGNLSGGNYVGRFDLAQQWRVTGENKRILANYPTDDAVEFYSGDDFVTAISPGSDGNWTCEAVFNIYNNYPHGRKVIASGDTIGWELRYSDSDDKTWRDGCFIADYFVGWVYTGPAAKNADYFGKLIFETAPEKSIEITTPVANTVWFSGEDGLIGWNSTGAISTLKIEISYDNGDSWEIITDSTANDKEFLWEIPGQTSDSCRIRISDFGNSAIFAISERFVIAQKPTLQITSPTSGTKWFIGDQKQISWTSQGEMDSLLLTLSRDSGLSWETLAILPGTASDFYWTVTGPPSDACLIKISDKNNPGISAVSNKFTLENEPVLQITQPQLNDIWYIGMPHRVAWNYQGSIDSIKIQLTRDDGQNWEALGTVAAADSEFAWQVTGPTSMNCEIKISDTENPLIFSQSALFSIVEKSRLEITRPDTSTTWYIGTQRQISWISQGEIDSVLIKLTRDQGNQWEVIGKVPNSTGDFSWLVTEPAATNCKICVADLQNLTVSDTTDFDLSISVPQIQVSPPDSILYVYSSVQFSWQTFGPIDRVNIELSRNDGQGWETLASRTANQGYFDWEISGAPSDRCVLRITDANHPQTQGLSTNFSIKNPELILQLPNGGETWEIDAEKQVRWQTEGNISQVKIELTRDAEASWEILTADHLNTGEFSWQVTGTSSEQCKIRISDTKHPNISSTSADFFSIAEIPFIQLKNPHGNETWQINSTQKIEWHSNSRIASVIIRLSRDNKYTWTTLIRNYENSGTYDWMVTGPEASESCYIRVQDQNDITLYSENQWPFSIENAPVSPQLELTTPTHNLAVEIGTNIPIQWQVTGEIAVVKIEFSRNGGKNWQELTTTNANISTYNWQSQPPLTQQGLFRITDPASGAMVISDTLELLPQFISKLENPNSQPAGSTQNGYRLVSIPLAAEYPQVDSVLLDDLGEYNRITWRLFDLRDAQYHEFPDVGQLIPGKSMFLIVREPYQVIDAGPGYAAMAESYAIPLVSGWNLVANPYETRVSGPLTVDYLSFSRSQEAVTLYSYEGAWGISRDFEPWTGYAVKTTMPDTLKVHPNWDSDYYKPQFEHKPDGWRIQIVATCESAVDSLNYLGTATDASLNRDGYDLFEPPPIGDFVQVYFPHRDWLDSPDDYTTDFQKPDPVGNSWKFIVHSNIPSADVMLKFAGLSEIEKNDLQVVLLDLAKNTQQKLHQNQDYFQLHLSGKSRKAFKLVVGKPEFVIKASKNFQSLPNHFQLFPNFPNPFNARTMIRFYLPEKSELKAEVFNLLGERVGVLFPAKEFKAGFYEMAWEANNKNGVELPSGIYLIIFKNSRGRTFIQKVMLVK